MRYVCNACTHPRQRREERRRFPCETWPVCGDRGTSSVFICDACSAKCAFDLGLTGAIVLDPARRYA